MQIPRGTVKMALRCVSYRSTRTGPIPSAIEEAAQVLERGGLVAFPTETVYGLGARAFDERAVLRVFNVKGRPQHHPLILHVTTENQARALAIGWPDAASRLARAFWPGPLTVVVQRGDRVPAAVAGGGVRSPSAHRGMRSRTP